MIKIAFECRIYKGFQRLKKWIATRLKPLVMTKDVDLQVWVSCYRNARHENPCDFLVMTVMERFYYLLPSLLGDFMPTSHNLCKYSFKQNVNIISAF